MDHRKLTGAAILRRAAGLRLRLLSNREVVVETASGEHVVGPHALAILDAFADPKPVCDVKARVGGAAAWVDWMTTVRDLFRVGALEDALSPSAETSGDGFDSLKIHIAMLNDRTRTGQYLEAIRRVVRPGDVVVDLGTGTGILALAAARAGARRVYAIEAGRVGDTAGAMFEANGYSHVIRLVRGWSTTVSIPERANVLVSEIIGDEPLGERVLESTLDARKRLLAADARFVPRRVEIIIQAVAVPRSVQADRRMFAGTASRWHDWYGFDFARVDEAARDQRHEFPVRPKEAQRWRNLSQPICAANLNLASQDSTAVDTTTEFETSRSGVLNAVVVNFRLELAPGLFLSSDPATAGADCHWKSWVCLLGVEWRVKPGERYRLRYTHNTSGDPPRIEITKA